MNTKLRTEAKIVSKKKKLKLINNFAFGKTMENVRNRRNIKLVTTDKKQQLESEPNYHTTKWFSEDLLATEMKKTKVKMNKPIIQVCQYQTLAKHYCMNFCMIILNQNIKKMQNYVIWILTALLFILKLQIFIKIVQVMLKKDMIHQITKLIDHCQKK